MACPFSYRAPKHKVSFGVDGEYLDFIEEQDRLDKEHYERTYPTCWLRFLHWLSAR
jgi:hypothetical protein